LRCPGFLIAEDTGNAIIEGMIGLSKESRRVVTRFDKLAESYAAMISPACVMRCLKHLFSGRA